MKSKIDFVSAPETILHDDDFCRCCGQKTSFVCRAEGVGIGYMYPCCDDDACRLVVHKAIIEHRSRLPYKKKQIPRWQVWIRWLAIRLAARERRHLELIRSGWSALNDPLP